MLPVAIDFETMCFAPGFMAPPIVCASTYHPQDGVRVWDTASLPGILERVLDEAAPILGHGFAYDACCWLEWYPDLARKLWDKYEADKVYDSIPMQRIIEISTGDKRGKLALDELARRYGIEMYKDQEVRVDFGRYYMRPLSEYSERHKRYVGGDSSELWTMFQRMGNRGLVSMRDLCDLTRGDLWLRLSSNWGVRTDPSRVSDLEATTMSMVQDLTEAAQGWGAMRKTLTKAEQRDGKWYSRDMKVIKQRVLDAYGLEHVPRTDSWSEADDRANPEHPDFDPLFAISTSKIVLDESGDPLLEALSELGELLAVRNKDVKMLQAGTEFPIHTRYGFAGTTRTTSSKPNLQNFRKKAGIRECLIPRAGNCFIETDYPSLELFTLAEVCAQKLDRHDLVFNMNTGRDYHAVIAAGILHTTYEDIMARKGSDSKVKNARDCGKYGNYGLCGYMTNPETFAMYVNLGSRTEENPRGLQWTAQQASEVMEMWRRNATDPVAFLKYVDTLKNEVGLYDVEIPGTTIMRRGCTRTAAANTHFQGLGATVARRAGWKIAKRQYIDRDMPSRTVLFVHDAFVAECRIEDRNEVARIQEECMAEALHETCPHMMIYPELEAKRLDRKDLTVIDSACMTHYSKYAKSKRDSNGNLIVCRVEKGEDGKWKAAA